MPSQNFVKVYLAVPRCLVALGCHGKDAEGWSYLCSLCMLFLSWSLPSSHLFSALPSLHHSIWLSGKKVIITHFYHHTHKSDHCYKDIWHVGWQLIINGGRGSFSNLWVCKADWTEEGENGWLHAWRQMWASTPEVTLHSEVHCVCPSASCISACQWQPLVGIMYNITWLSVCASCLHFSHLESVYAYVVHI